MKKQLNVLNNSSPFLVSSFLYLRIFSGEATTAPPLGPILGQNQLNINEYCKEFNAQSNIFYENLLLNIFVIKNIEKKGDFKIVLKIPTIDFFFDQILYFNGIFYFIFANEAFDIIKIKAQELGVTLKKMANFFLSFLKSTNCKKILN